VAHKRCDENEGFERTYIWGGGYVNVVYLATSALYLDNSDSLTRTDEY